MSWTWEFNLATLLALIGAFASVVAGWVTTRSTAQMANRRADEAHARAEKAIEKTEILNGAFTAYRETMASTMVTRDSLRDLKNELFDRFDKLSERMDRALSGRSPSG